MSDWPYFYALGKDIPHPYPSGAAIIIAEYKALIVSEDFQIQVHRWRAMPEEALPPRS